MLLSPEKTKSMVVATRQKHQRGIPPLRVMLNSQVTEQVSEHHHIRVILNDQLKWTLLLEMCTCCLASDTFVTVKLVILFFFSRAHYVQN